MRTRAQASRDAALRRLTRVNHTLAVAAVVGTGVVTDIVANTASGHTRTVSENASSVTTTPAPARHPHHTARRAEHHAAATSSENEASSSETAATSSSTAQVSTVQPTAVVAVSGGS